MFQQANPFLQHAINQGQSLLSEVSKTRSLSQDIISACDNIMMSINSGNTQNALNSVQNVRNMASQVSQSTQFFNQAINERLDMASYVFSAIQHKISEMSGAIQSLRMTTSNYQPGWSQYGMHQHSHYTAPQQQWQQYGPTAPQ